jgi:lipopolysaccharide/colanic/teichoic acid biosynthesis glycosyltransferase
MKRLLDILVAGAGLIVSAPVLLPVIFLIWRHDYHSPFYIATRVGRHERPFRMIKLRSMVMNADKAGVDSTSATDSRITPVGHFVRRYKLDELTQLWNVLIGDMSVVGPRPNVKRETDLYTAVEKKLLLVRPGITDFASIVFSDEGDILSGKPDPDIAYNQLIRPWKSRLGILYVEKRSLWLDIRLIVLTALALVNRRAALLRVQRLLLAVKADEDLIRIAGRQDELVPHAPPGASQIVTSRA